MMESVKKMWGEVKEAWESDRQGIVLLLLGFFFIFVGVVGGAFVAFWWCIGGGVVSIVNGFQTDPMSAGLIAWGVVKCFLAAPLGWITFAIGLGSAKLCFENA